MTFIVGQCSTIVLLTFLRIFEACDLGASINRFVLCSVFNTSRDTVKYIMFSTNTSGAAAAQRPSPNLQFTVHPSAAPFRVSQQAYLAAHPDPRYTYIATGSLVFDTSNKSCPRLLLLQRATHDSMPNKWEVPGGGCDDDDESILYAAARELWEEAGLKAVHLGAPVGRPYFLQSRSGKKVCKFVFPVQAETNSEGRMDVTLDPREHQSFTWASEEEVKAKRIKDTELEFTHKDLECIVLAAFSQFKT
ncbi:NUDIX hydrolase domain-like protein [Trichoderma sp. SZMC 28015]